MKRLGRRQGILLAVVGLLAILNIWRFWPGPSPALPGAPAGSGRSGDFQVKALPSAADSQMKRDLFARVVKPAPVVVAKAPPPPPPKSPEQLAREAAQAELASLRCVGVVFRGGTGQAFMVLGDQSQVVRAGERVGTRFVVERITPEAVTVRDPDTQVTGQIAVSGK
jgi:hypothetical protein